MVTYDSHIVRVSASPRVHCILVLLLASVACRPPPPSGPGLVPERSLVVHVDVQQRANQDTPVGLALVLVREPALLASLSSLSASDWFAGGRQFLRDHPHALDEHVWEFVPGQTIEPQRLPLRPVIHGALLFVRFHGIEPHRYRIDPARDVHVSLGVESIQVSQSTRSTERP